MNRSDDRRERFERGEVVTIADVLPGFVLEIDELFGPSHPSSA